MKTNDGASEKQVSAIKVDSREGGNDNRAIEKTPPRRIPGNDAGKVVILEGFDDFLSEFDI